MNVVLSQMMMMCFGFYVGLKILTYIGLESPPALSSVVFVCEPIFNVGADLMDIDAIVQVGLMVELDSAMGHQGSVLPFSHWFRLTCLDESQTILDCAEDEICRMIHSHRFWVQSIAKLNLLIKGLAYDPSQGPETIQRYFQTGGETYEHGWIS